MGTSKNSNKAVPSTPAAVVPLERVTYTVREAAKVIGIGRDLCYQLAHSGELRTVMLNRRILVPKSAVTELIEGTPTVVASPLPLA